ncbi:nicotinic acetylcholine receptor subunit beta3-like protein [Leptotrombidium deliense]|uniref:Nicotinic acetylcholine receptor subunit beta3-like protein n=1 Tax=Leptotrombidium deliense TaxID=299467 RepID=A0A443SJK0_9ACAR|nr:nicotinic acetylcholine receptor subunit beta3-like protein [Leptotrombidium deliense]
MIKMITVMLNLLLLFSLFCVASSETDEVLDYIKLREQLLVKNAYNRNIRPVKDHSKTLMSSNALSTDLYTSLMWQDEQLQWNPTDYNNLTKIEFEFSELWTPDVIAWNSVDKSVQDLSETRLVANSTGHVTWLTKGSMKTFCMLNYQDYPFDTQKCYLTFGSWMYVTREVNLTRFSDKDKFYYGPYIRNPEWEYVNVSGNYYATSLLVVTTFFTPIGSKYRYLYTNLAVGILIVLLFYISFKIGLWGTGVPYAVRCLSVNLLITIIFVLISTLLHFQCRSLIRKRVNPPQFLVTYLDIKLVNTILCLTTKSEKSLVTENDEESVTELRVNLSSKWTVLLEIIDRFCCFLYILLWIIFHS